MLLGAGMPWLMNGEAAAYQDYSPMIEGARDLSSWGRAVLFAGG
jgi:hypothetical protein